MRFRKSLVRIGFAAAVTVAGALLPFGSGAATAVNVFSVGITLNSACEVMTVPTISFAYTSFQPSDSTQSSSFNIRCTDTKSITSVRLDDGFGGVAAGLTQSYTDQATGLNYTLTLSGVPAAGNGAAQTISVSGVMALGQAGTCSAASCTNAASANKTRTITITY
jgi:spore coat protein U-like protein